MDLIYKIPVITEITIYGIASINMIAEPILVKITFAKPYNKLLITINKILLSIILRTVFLKINSSTVTENIIVLNINKYIGNCIIATSLLEFKPFVKNEEIAVTLSNWKIIIIKSHFPTFIIFLNKPFSNH